MVTAAAELTPSASPGMNGMPPTVNGNGVSNGTHGHHLTRLDQYCNHFDTHKCLVDVATTSLFNVKQIFNWNSLNESDLKYWSKYLHSLSSTKAKIFELTSYSSKLETVLLALLKDQQDMLDKFEAFQSVYERDKGEVKLNSFRSIKKLFPTHIFYQTT